MKKYQKGSVRIGQIQKSDSGHLAAKKSIPVLLLCLVMLLNVQIAFGQSGLSTLRGAVLDQTGAAVAGVTVTLTEPATGVTVRTVISGNNGEYEIPSIKPGIYRLKAERNGFKPFVADNLLLESSQTRRQDLSLTVGGTTEEVTIEAGAATINSESGTLSAAFDAKKFSTTPLTDTYPSPLAMFATLPGVQGNGWDLKVAGQNASQQSIGLDGAKNDRTGEQMNNMNFYQEAVITTVNAGADSSRLGNYNLVSKRGSNDFHGMMYYKHFNSGLNATTFWENANNQKKTAFIQHEWMAEIGGPIWKNKTHFYFAWMQQRLPLGSFAQATVPNDAMRAGDFSGVLVEDEDGNPIPLKDPLTGKAFAGNKLPLDRINAMSAKLQQQYIPKANGQGTADNYSWVHPYNSDFYLGNWPFLRLDHQLTSKNTIYGKWHKRKTPYVLQNGLPDFYWTRLRDHSQTVISDTHVFSSTLVNSFRFGWSHDYIIDGEENDGQKPIQGHEAVANIGLQGVNPKGYKSAGFPTMNISGQGWDFTSLSTVAGGVKNNDDSFNIADDVTFDKSQHIFKTGFEVSLFKRFAGEVPDYGRFRFDGRYTGYAYADFLLGYPYRVTRTDPLVNRKRNAKEFGIYFMDTFKVTPKLTLDLGLRWDYYGMPTYADGLMYNLDLESGKIFVPEDKLDKLNPLLTPAVRNNIVAGQVVPDVDMNNIRPRISAAYRLSNDFVIRGGYGSFTERFGRDYFELVNGPGPFTALSENFTDTDSTPSYSFPNPFPSGGASKIGTLDVRALPKKWDNGTIHQFNLSIEKEVKKISLRTSYVGSRGRGLTYDYNTWSESVNANIPVFNSGKSKPYPLFSNVYPVRNDGKSNFDSIQFEAQRRFGSYTFDAHYTLSSNMNNILISEDPYNPTSQWARDADTRRHLAVVTTTWELPIGKGRRFLAGTSPIIDGALGGWQLQTISYFGSGTYFSPYYEDSDTYAITGKGTARPDLVGNPTLSGDKQTVNQWYNNDAFKRPTNGFGSAGANILQGQGLNAHHLSLTKQFKFNERWSFTFTSSITNIFNKPHFYNPDGNFEGSLKLGGTVEDFYPEKQGRRVVSFKGRLNF